jgi:hypothetical protein
MPRRQTTRHILMVRPANFGFNEETAVNNAFQRQDGELSPDAIRKQARKEFDRFVEALREAGVQVIVAQDSARPYKPDAVFPNNWVSFHQEGLIITYPMFAPLRRKERRRGVIDAVLGAGFSTNKRVNLAYNEKINRYLEGTGSVIFDHVHRLAYACLSPRTDAQLLHELCRLLEYQPVAFHATDSQHQDIYHTNVMMALGEDFVVVCLESVRDEAERRYLTGLFEKTGKEIVEISLAQMNAFAGNMLQVRNDREETILVMSEQAYRALNPTQIATLERHTRLLHSPLDVIERYGGGSARCMMAEVFLPEVS